MELSPRTIHSYFRIICNNTYEDKRTRNVGHKRTRNFGHSLSQRYQKNRIQSTNRRINLPAAKKNEQSPDEEDHKKLIGEIDRLSCLFLYDDQDDKTFCGVLWKAVLAEILSVVAEAEDGIEVIFSKAVEGSSGSVQISSELRNKSSNREKSSCVIKAVTKTVPTTTMTNRTMDMTSIQ